MWVRRIGATVQFDQLALDGCRVTVKKDACFALVMERGKVWLIWITFIFLMKYKESEVSGLEGKV